MKESTVFIAGPSKENGQLMLKRPKLLNGFQGMVFYCYYFKIFIYSLAVLGVSCGMRGLLLWHMGSSLRCGACAGFSLVVARGLQSI